MELLDLKLLLTPYRRNWQFFFFPASFTDFICLLGSSLQESTSPRHKRKERATNPPRPPASGVRGSKTLQPIIGRAALESMGVEGFAWSLNCPKRLHQPRPSQPLRPSQHRPFETPATPNLSGQLWGTRGCRWCLKFCSPVIY